MIRIGIHSLQQALERAGARDLDVVLRRHLERLSAAQQPAVGPESASSTPPPPPPAREAEPLSDLFLALCESVAEKYLEKREPDAAARVVWEAFIARRGLTEYRALRTWAQNAGAWPEWREKAWEQLDAQGGEAVAILLWEGHLEEAWTRAQRHGARDVEWLEIARRREQDHPVEAFEIYRRRVEGLIPRTDLGSYRESVRWLRRMEALQVAVGKEREFADFVESVRARSVRRPRFVRLLDESLGPEGFAEREDGNEAP